MFLEMFYAVLLLLTGIGVFLVGIIKFSNILQSGSNDHLKLIFQKMGDNRLIGFGVGTAATTIIQSSTATTVIVVSLVNASILTLYQSAAVIFGANVGTAVSNMLLSLSAFRIKYLFMSLVFFGAFAKMFTASKSINKIADVCIGFGIIFVGLELMGTAFPADGPLSQAFTDLFKSVTFPLLLILLAFVLTAIINSSSATIAIFITLAAKGLIDFHSIMYLVLGVRLGTTVTTLISSISASQDAKRSALIHLMFNIAVAVIWLPILWPFQETITDAFNDVVPDPVWQIPIFTLIVTLLTAILVLPFVRPICKLTHKIIREKPIPTAVEIVMEAERPDEQGEAFQHFSDKF